MWVPLQVVSCLVTAPELLTLPRDSVPGLVELWSEMDPLERRQEALCRAELVLPLSLQVAPMSVYACLGSDAAAIRDAFLTRLQSRIEDMRIKVMILEFLTVAVETQPGLIELFLNLEVKDGSDGSKVE